MGNIEGSKQLFSKTVVEWLFREICDKEVEDEEVIEADEIVEDVDWFRFFSCCGVVWLLLVVVVSVIVELLVDLLSPFSVSSLIVDAVAVKISEAEIK